MKEINRVWRAQLAGALEALANMDLQDPLENSRTIDGVTAAIFHFDEDVPAVDTLVRDFELTHAEASAFKAVLDCWDLLCAVTKPTYFDVAQDSRLHAMITLAKYALLVFEGKIDS